MNYLSTLKATVLFTPLFTSIYIIVLIRIQNQHFGKLLLLVNIIYCSENVIILMDVIKLRKRFKIRIKSSKYIDKLSINYVISL